MGKSCSCCNTECCLCDKAWSITTWSVNILGQNFNGQFLPLNKPDPFTQQNSCHSRVGDCCIVENPILIDDCRQESDWLDLPYNPCCPQCICTGYVNGGSGLVYGYCEILGLLNYELSYKGVTHTRTWQQESYYGTAQMYQCCDTVDKNKTRFIFDLYYHVVRFSAESQQAYTRYRTVSWDCLYDPPFDQVTAPDNLIRGEWIQPVEVGIYPPCIPCSWPQSTFFGNCQIVSGYECQECPNITGCEDVRQGSASLISIGLIFGCNFTFADFGILDPNEERICRVTDQYRQGSRTITVASFSPRYCTNLTVGPNAQVRTFTHRYMSDCIDCNNIPPYVTLNRITGFPGPITQYLFDGLYNPNTKSPCNGVLPPLEKIIPPSIIMNLV